MSNLTKRFVDAAKLRPAGKEVTYWDDKLKGFGLRVQSGRSASWVIMYRTHENRLRKLTIGKADTLTPDEARKEARQKLAEADRGGDPAGEKSAARKAMTVAELCDWYLKEAAEWVKPSTLDMDRSRIDCHVKPLIGNRSVKGLTVSDLARMQSDIAAGKTAKRKTGRGGHTTGGKGAAARTLSMVGTILEFAKRRGLIKENPARSVQKYPSQRRTRYLSFEEIAELGRAIEETAKLGENRTGAAAIKALLLTGCRRNEILTLPWDWFDAKSRCIRFGDTKTGAQIRPIGRSAIEFIAAQPKFDNCPWIFPTAQGDGHFVGLPRVFARICRHAKFEDVTIHTLRHTFASVAAEIGFSELTIAGLLGHSLGGITARYAHVPDSALLTAADRVSARIAAALEGQAEAEVTPFPIASAAQ